MSWTAGGNITKASEIDELEISGEPDDAQVAAAKDAAKVLVADLGTADEYIVHLGGQTEPDHGAGQAHAPQAAISVHVATTVPLHR